MSRAPRPSVSLLVSLLAIAAWALPLAAAGQDPPAAEPDPGRGACHADIQRFCADAMGRRGSCLREHWDELAPACRERMESRSAQRSQKRAGVRAACGEDLERLCPDLEPGKGSPGRCLRQHESELSPACREALPPRGGGGRPAS